MPKHTDTIDMYNRMRETFIYLTHLDCNDTRSLLTKGIVLYICVCIGITVFVYVRATVYVC